MYTLSIYAFFVCTDSFKFQMKKKTDTSDLVLVHINVCNCGMSQYDIVSNNVGFSA
jgi:hypothetical protein